MDGDEQDDRSDLAQLLPFYVNGTLTPTERTRLEAALAVDADLRAELAAVGEISALVTEGGVGLAHIDPDLSADRLGRLVSQIDEDVASSAPSRGLPRRSRRTGSDDNGRRADAPKIFWRRAFAAAALVAVVQAGVIISQMSGRDRYESLSGPVTPVPVHTPRLLLRLAPEASWGDVQTLLASRNLTIVAGPIGETIEVALGPQATLQTEIDDLRASPLVVFAGAAS